MAEEPTKPTESPAETQPGSASASPAPKDVTDSPPAAGAPAGASTQPPADGQPAPGAPQAEPLSDGTVPTVLKTGDGHRSVRKGRVSIANIYRKADIMTTLFTFIGVVVAAAIVVGAYYWFFARNQKAVTTTPPGKVTNLSQSDLQKLGSFFGGNSAGSSSQVLTVSSASLFNGRVAVNSDLKVTGGLEVSGPTSLSNLAVSGTSNLGVSNVRGSLTVAGPTVLQSPATLSGGATITGNTSVSGNGSFGGSVSAGVINTTTLTVNGTLNLGGHLSITGSTPSASGAAGLATSASVEGNDASGVVTVNLAPVSNHPVGAQIVTLTFHTAYPRAPHVVITPVGRDAALLMPYIQIGATSFTIGAANLPANSNATSYSFDYWVVQ